MFSLTVASHTQPFTIFPRFIFVAWKQVFVANPNKPREIVQVLVDNHRELLKLLHNLPTSKGTNVVVYCLLPVLNPSSILWRYN